MSWQAALAHASASTPFLAVHAPTLMANITRTATSVTARSGVGTPHLKTHKCLDIARAQREHGATRATVATMREAELALAAGFNSLLVAYPPVTEARLEALGRLADRASVAVVCSSPEHVARLRQARGEFDVYWEVESGTMRLGTQPGAPTRDAVLASAFDDRVRLTGLMTFAGHAYSASNESDLLRVREQQDEALRGAMEHLGEHCAPLVRSVGVTPLRRHDTDANDEFRYGNYVFNDATQVALGSAELEMCALVVVTTVVDTPDHHRAVVDAGAKSLPAERMTTRSDGFGVMLGKPEVSLERLYEEHGLCVSRSAHGLKVGDRLAIIPNHACTAANLHARYEVFDDAGHLDTWAIATRASR